MNKREFTAEQLAPLKHDHYKALAERLHGMGAHMVLCGCFKGSEWDPKKAFREKWQERPEDAIDVARHLNRSAEGKPTFFGLKPASLGIVVVDIDEGGFETAKAVAEAIGQPLFRYMSSCADGRAKFHFCYPCGDTAFGNVKIHHPETKRRIGELRCANGYVRIPKTHGATAWATALGKFDRAKAKAVDLTPIVKGIGGQVLDLQPGNRNNALNQAVFQAALRNDIDAAKRARQKGLAVGLTPGEVEATFKSAWNSGHAEWLKKQPKPIRVELPSPLKRPNLPCEGVSFLWHPWLPLGELSLLAAPGGAGKGTFIAWMASMLTTGRPMPGQVQERKPVKILWLSAEDHPGRVVKPNVIANEGDPSLILFGDDLDLLKKGRPEDCAKAMVDNDVKLAVIDPILRGIKDSNADQHVRPLLERYAAIARIADIAMLGLSHNAKYQRTKLKEGGHVDLVRGSAAITEVPRMVWQMTKDHHDKKQSRVMIAGKFNLIEHPGDAFIRLHGEQIKLGKDDKGRPYFGRRLAAKLNLTDGEATFNAALLHDKGDEERADRMERTKAAVAKHLAQSVPQTKPELQAALTHVAGRRALTAALQDMLLDGTVARTVNKLKQGRPDLHERSQIFHLTGNGDDNVDDNGDDNGDD